MSAWKNGEKRQRMAELIARDGTRCHWCDVETIPVPRGHQGRLHPRHRTIDHLLDRTRGGTNDLTNLVIACDKCNGRRSEESREAYAGILTENQFKNWHADLTRTHKRERRR